MPGELQGYAIISLGNFEGDSSVVGTLPVYDDALGTLQVVGPPDNRFGPHHDVAPNGQFLVATIEYGDDIGLYLWDAVNKRFDDTPIDVLVGANTPTGGGTSGPKISPDSSVVVFGQGGSPFVRAVAVSSAGFGADYPPPSLLPSDSVIGIAWHPSGNAIALTNIGATMSLEAWEWAGGFGTKYADPADPMTGVGVYGDISGFWPKFSPDGAWLYVYRRSTDLTDGDRANGQFRIYAFDPVSGFGARVPFSATPWTTGADSNQSDFNGEVVVMGTGVAPGLDPYANLLHYIFDPTGPSIGPYQELSNPEDPYMRNWHAKFSNNGRYLVTAHPYDGISVWRVENDHSLTKIGPSFNDSGGGGFPWLGWRDP